MSINWHTLWQNHDVVLFRGDTEVDRLPGGSIERVIFVYGNRGESPGDLLYAVVVLPDDCVFMPADTGFAGRVNFERQQFWEDRACVYWVSDAQARLPSRYRRGRWFMPRAVPPYARIPRSELGPVIDGWPMQGPHTWEQRKWMRIHRSHPFSSNDGDTAPRLRA